MKRYIKTLFILLTLSTAVNCQKPQNNQSDKKKIAALNDSIVKLNEQNKFYKEAILTINNHILNNSDKVNLDNEKWKHDSLTSNFIHNFAVYSESNKSQNETVKIKVLTDTLVKIIPDEKIVSENKKLQTELEKTQATLIQKENEKIALNIVSSKNKKIQYTGKVRNNKANGFGVGVFETGSIYRGEWKNNNRHGKGTFTWKDGEFYEGNFHNDQRSGYGKYYWGNGEVYEGEWKNDMRHGKGTVYKKNGTIKKEGTWDKDKWLNQ